MTLLINCHLLLVMALSMQVYTSCYYPDGIYVAEDRPCIDNGTQESFCCGPSWWCLSNKVCYRPSTSQYARGSCTDESFGSPACPHFCLSMYIGCLQTIVTDRVSAIAPANKAPLMSQCGDQTDSYCCSLNGLPCSCESGNITLGASSSDVSSIAFIPSAVSTVISESQVLPVSVTSGT